MAVSSLCSANIIRRILNSLDWDFSEVLVQLEIAYRELVASQLYRELTSEQERSIHYVARALQLVREREDFESSRRYQASTICSLSRGRPRFDIPRHQISTMLEMHFTVPSIAEILGVSVRTVRRRMSEYNLSVGSLYFNLTDEQLDGIVQEIQYQFPTCGNRQMMGHLQSRGLRVHQHRVRESQRRIDPEGSVMRRLRTIRRRRYCVSGPGALWHIDGHHKLIRFVLLCHE